MSMVQVLRSVKRWLHSVVLPESEAPVGQPPSELYSRVWQACRSGRPTTAERRLPVIGR